jgi:hypothetical protein
MNILSKIREILRRKKRAETLPSQQRRVKEPCGGQEDPYAEAYPELSQEERDLLETQEIEEDD